MKMRIKVKQEHIEAGTPCSIFACPVFYALQCAGFNVANVMGRTASFWEASPEDSALMISLLPKETVSWIKKFDEGKKVKPFSFSLDWDSAKMALGF